MSQRAFLHPGLARLARLPFSEGATVVWLGARSVHAIPTALRARVKLWLLHDEDPRSRHALAAGWRGAGDVRVHGGVVRAKSHAALAWPVYNFPRLNGVDPEWLSSWPRARRVDALERPALSLAQAMAEWKVAPGQHGVLVVSRPDALAVLSAAACEMPEAWEWLVACQPAGGLDAFGPDDAAAAMPNGFVALDPLPQGETIVWRRDDVRLALAAELAREQSRRAGIEAALLRAEGKLALAQQWFTGGSAP